MFKLSLNLLRFKYNNLLCTRVYPLPQVRTPAKNDSLTHSSVRIMLLYLGKSYSSQNLTRFQAAGYLANAPWRQQPG